MILLETCAAMLLSLVVLGAQGGPSSGRVPNTPPVLEVVPELRASSDRRGQTGAHIAAHKVRGLQRELEEFQNKVEGIPAMERTRWQMERSLDLAAKAEKANVERDLLESLLRSGIANGAEKIGRYSAWNMTQKTLTAVALWTLEQNLVGKEKEFLVPTLRRGYSGVPLPGEVRGVLDCWSLNGGGDLFGTALAAIDSYADDRANDFLLVYALDTSEDKYGQPSPLTAAALWFLSCYEPKPIKAKLDAALQSALKALPVGAKRIPARTRLGRLLSCLTDLEYAESLEPGPRKRFQRMLRLLRYTYVMSPQFSTVPPRANPAILFPSWQDGDERFLPHLLATGRIPPHIMIAKAPISPEGWAWLKEQPGWGDWRPAHLKRELPKILRAREGVKEPPERPDTKGSPKR